MVTRGGNKGETSQLRTQTLTCNSYHTIAQVLSEVASAAALEKVEGEGKTRTRSIMEAMSKVDWKGMRQYTGMENFRWAMRNFYL